MFNRSKFIGIIKSLFISEYNLAPDEEARWLHGLIARCTPDLSLMTRDLAGDVVSWSWVRQ